MLECRRCRKHLRDAQAGGSDAALPADLERHLAVCPDCRAEAKGLKEIAMASGRRWKPDPGPEYWEGYWDRLQARMMREDAQPAAEQPGRTDSSSNRRRFWLKLAMPAAAAALLAAGILIGRFGSRPVPGPRLRADVVQASDLEIRTGRYLDRSKRILLALVNYAPGTKDAYGLDLPGQKEASRSLVREASGLKSELAKNKSKRLEKLVGDLQTILRQIANLEAENDLAAVDIARAGVEGRDIIFKINMAEMRGGSSPRRIF
jgi:hypothetical protein